MSRIPDLDEFLDPKGLTPQELYKLQSETWAQGAESERERIIKLLEDTDSVCSYWAIELIKMDKDESLNDDDYEIPIKYIEEDDWEPHPPQAFRDKGNGE